MKSVTLREQLLKGAEPILEQVLAAARGEQSLDHVNDWALTKVWEAVVPIIQKAEEATPVTSLIAGEVSEKIDGVLAEVAQGKLSVQQGKELMALIQAGFEVSDLQDLIGKLEEAGVIKQ